VLSTPRPMNNPGFILSSSITCVNPPILPTVSVTGEKISMKTTSKISAVTESVEVKLKLDMSFKKRKQEEIDIGLSVKDFFRI
jgi:hypothetical protein